MALADMEWTPTTVHRVVLPWLRAERDKYAKTFAQLPADFWPAGLDALLDNASTSLDEENRARLSLFYHSRLVFLVEIPPDTAWYEVRNLRHKDLVELRAVNYGPWIDPNRADQNELFKVAERRKDIEYQTPWSEWQPPILWGHDRNGPFTIIEGNHRLIGYVRSNLTDLNVPAFVGLSPTGCHWHIIDQCDPLIVDYLSGLFNEVERLRRENATLRRENAALRN